MQCHIVNFSMVQLFLDAFLPYVHIHSERKSLVMFLNKGIKLSLKNIEQNCLDLSFSSSQKVNSRQR